MTTAAASIERVRKLHIAQSSDRAVAGGLLRLDVSDLGLVDDGAMLDVFSDHVLEGLSHADGAAHLAECCRVLAPAGVFRVATLNLSFVMDLYGHRMNNDPLERSCIARMVHHAFPETGFQHAAFAVNSFFHSRGGGFVYDPATLVEALRRAGFGGIVRRAPMSGDPGAQTMVFEATRP